jgi:5-methylcytosine-specific restriction enzyme A
MRGLPRRCIEPSCPHLVRDGYRCPAHQRQADQARDARRGTTAQRGLGAAWQVIARKVIAEEGACRDCGHTGSPANPLTCDHIVPRALGGTDERGNLTCRCRRHNSAKGASGVVQ